MKKGREKEREDGKDGRGEERKRERGRAVRMDGVREGGTDILGEGESEKVRR